MSSQDDQRLPRKMKESDDASSVAGGAKIDETRGGEEQLRGSTKIETGSGVYIGGNVSTGGGDFIGRDKIEYGGMVRLDAVFQGLDNAVDTLPDGPKKTMATAAVEGLKIEAKKGQAAEEKNIQQWFEFLASTAPDIYQIALETFTRSWAGMSEMFKMIADQRQGG